MADAVEEDNSTTVTNGQWTPGACVSTERARDPRAALRGPRVGERR
jgi:hypothetical protein